MARVNIITVTTAKGPSKQKAIGMFLVETMDKGFPETYHKCLIREETTGTELTLQLLANALTVAKHRETEFETVTIFTDEPIVEQAFENKWIEKWQEQDWKNAKGKEVSNCEIWQMIWNLMQEIGKKFIVTSEKSSYTNWMLNQCELEQKKMRNHEMVEENLKRVRKMLDGNE